MTIDRKFITGANVSLDHKAALHSIVDAIDSVVTVPNTTATATEINSLTGQAASATTAATPASGTCGVQFVFKDAAGVALAHAVSGQAYFSNSTGLAIAAATSAAVLTNGMWLDVVAGKTAIFTTDATGKLGVTVTGAAATYYISFVLPDGKIITSSALVVNA